MHSIVPAEAFALYPIKGAHRGIKALCNLVFDNDVQSRVHLRVRQVLAGGDVNFCTRPMPTPSSIANHSCGLGGCWGSQDVNGTCCEANVGVDRHAVALRRKVQAPAHGLRRNAGACPRRTSCSTATYAASA